METRRHTVLARNAERIMELDGEAVDTVWQAPSGATLTHAVALAGGGLIAVGRWEGSADFGDGAPIDADGLEDIFVLWLNDDGELLAKAWIGSPRDHLGDILEDPYDEPKAAVALADDSLLLIGVGDSEPTTLETSAGDMVERGAGEFVARFDAGGALLWVDDNEHDISAVDPLPEGGFVARSSVHLARFDGDHELVWETEVADAWFGDLCATPDGGAVLAGAFEGSTVFGQGEAGEQTLEVAGGEQDLYMARLDAEGALLWARRAAGMGDDWSVGEGSATQP